MSFKEFIRDSRFLRAPILALTKACLRPMATRLPLLRRAAYDVEPMPYLVVGDREKYVVSTKDKVIGRELFLHGEFDFQKLVTALEILRREGYPVPRHLMDVGANIGSIVIPALARGLMESAVAVEPHPHNIRLLRANLALNGIDKCVRVFEQAVGSESNEKLFLQESSTNSGKHSIGDTGIPIQCTRIDDIAEAGSDFLLWLDIEGYEGHALKGAQMALSKSTPVVSEFNPYFLKEHGGLELFIEALERHRIFDLKHECLAKETSLDALVSDYTESSLWTDILAIPRN